jgi:hypothetical protein
MAKDRLREAPKPNLVLCEIEYQGGRSGAPNASRSLLPPVAGTGHAPGIAQGSLLSWILLGLLLVGMVSGML